MKIGLKRRDKKEEISQDTNNQKEEYVRKFWKFEDKSLLGRIKKLKYMYEESKGVPTFIKILLLLVVTFIIMYSSMIYNKVNFVIDFSSKDAIIETFSRINEVDSVFMETTINDVWINYIFTLGIILIGYAIIGSLKISVVFSGVIWVVINIISSILLSLRGTAFAFADIFSLNTGLAVINGMEITLNKSMKKYIWCTVITLVGFCVFKFRKNDNKKQRWIFRGVNLVLGIILLVIGMQTPKYKNLNYWDLETKYRDNGTQMIFIKQIDDFFISKPEGYSVKKVEEILSRYSEKNVENIDEKANVIIVMNESFADMNKIYEFGFEDNMPYYNSIKENTVKGTYYTSGFGGGTATVEWEVLTENSAAFIPKGAIPYIVYMDKNKDTLVNNFRNLGYDTYAFHSYLGKCYNRKLAYPKIGFNHTYFIEDMPGIPVIKSNHPTDIDTYKYVIDKYENRDKSQKFFAFVLTMQNHSPYNFDTYQNKGYDVNNKEVDQYLSLVKDSDDALKELIDYYSKEEEKTVILYFGDHQPKLNTKFEQDEWLESQKVPYMLWTNFEIEEKEEDTSNNYFGTLLYDYAGVTDTRYTEFLKDMKKQIPIFTSKGYKGIDGNVYEVDDENSPYYNIIKEYELLEYYFMFDKNVE